MGLTKSSAEIERILAAPADKVEHSIHEPTIYKINTAPFLVVDLTQKTYQDNQLTFGFFM